MSVDSTIRKAQRLARAGDRDGAIALLRQVLAKSPGNRTAQRGLSALTRAAAKASGSASAKAGTARAGLNPEPRVLKGLERLLKRPDPAPAVAEGQRLALLFPASAPVFNLLGIALTRAGRREEAVTAFSRLADLHPKSAGAWFNKANALINAGKVEAAAQAAGRALKLDANLFQAARLRGFARARLGQYAGAEADFRAAIRIAPDNPLGHLGLGNVCAATHRPEDALASYQRARDLDPDNPEAANNIGAALVQLDRPEEAVALLERTIEANPRNRMLHTNLAKALRDLGQPEAALTHVEAALDLGAATDELLALQAAVLRDLGEDAGATSPTGPAAGGAGGA